MGAGARGNARAVIRYASGLVAIAAVAACQRAESAGEANGGAASAAVDFRVEVVASGLEVPWAFDFAPDGRIFLTERAGSIRVIRDGKLEPKPWATLPVAATGEAGLMGIAVAPDFASSRAIYVVGTFRAGESLVNRVIRYTDQRGVASEPDILIDGIPAARFHAGDAIAFGPDGMMYVATGDAMDPGSARKPESLAGKILRYRPDGTIPADNPLAGSAMYAFGVRNVQGLAWSPDGQLFATDHGPSGFPNERFRRNHDEMNVIVAGGNFGWPDAAGRGGAPRYLDPLMEWNDPGVAPSGIAFYDAPLFASWRGSVFVAALRGERLLRVAVRRDSAAIGGWRVLHQETVVDTLGRLRAVRVGPDGAVWFTTSNRDGRGSPRPGDDRLLRVVPSRRAAR